MGGLWSSISKLFFSIPPSRILMVGLDAAGKTTILYRIKLGENVVTIPTIGFNVETVKCGSLEFTVWDCGFRDKMVPLWRHYYPGTDGIIFVVDSNDVERMDEAKRVLETVLSDDELRQKPLVMSNNVYLKSSKSSTEVTDLLELHKYKDRHWFLQETCALTGQGLMQGFEWLAANISKS